MENNSDIRVNPYRYICNYYESLYPFMGRKVFSIVSLMPGSLILPPIPDGRKKIKQKINLFLIANPGCQPKGSKVLMSNGEWKNIEDIKDGDKVISPQNDGTNIFVKVKKITKWISHKNYKILEKKNNNILYRCSYNHNIPYFECFGEHKINKNIADYLSSLTEGKLRRRRCFSTFPILNFENKNNCKIEPYCLGVWLGDGFFSSIRKKNKLYKGNKNIKINGFYKSGWGKNPKDKIYTKSHNRINNNKNIHKGNWISRKLGITSADEEIINEVSKFYKIIRVDSQKNNKSDNYCFSVNGKFSELLSIYGLEGKGSGEKFIPEEALLSNINYRRRLLAGLIDTDGYMDKRSGVYEISTKSNKLAEGIKNLIFSLGYRSRVKPFKVKNYVGTYYKISFCLREKFPIKTKRKNRENPRNLRKKPFNRNPNTITINLKEYGSEEVYGIEVDSPSHNYITDNWMVTGNTGKTSLAEEFEKICYNPIFSEYMTPAYLNWELKDKDQVTIITSDVAQALTNEEFVKLLEQILGDEGAISRSTMTSKEKRRKIDTIAFLSGTPNLISNDRIRDGLLFRCSPLVVTHSLEEHEKILDAVNENIGEDTDGHDREHIIDFYSELKSIQDGTHKEFDPITGYVISKEIKEELIDYIKPLVQTSFEEFGINAVRQLHEAYRFMVSHAFLNIHHRTIEKNKLVIEERDLKIAKYLIEIEIETIFHIVDALSELNKRGIKTYKQLREWQDKDRLKKKKLDREKKFLMEGAVKK